MNDLISIIVPVYNIANYLNRSIESILNQTYENIEIIAVDDGSTDDSLSLLQKISSMDNRLHVIHQENGGVTKARLTGVKAASGEWIGFVDGDDEIEPDMYERLMNNAIKYKADISHCGYQMVFPSRIDFYYNTGFFKLQDNQTGLKDLLGDSFMEPGLCNKLYRKRLFHSLLHEDVMDLTIKNKEDLLMNYYLFDVATKSIYEDFCPYHYILRPNSAATQSINEHKLLDPLRVTEHLMFKTKGNNELHQIVKCNYIWKLISLSTEDKKIDKELITPIQNEARKKLRENIKLVVCGRQFTIKLKCLALWATIWPTSYRIVHDIYLHQTGKDKKYEIV